MPKSNDSDLKLRDLRLLEVMLTEGSLTRAAIRLDTTQPSLSKALARLRVHFGDPLLVRDGQAMRPTPKGTEMLAPIRQLLRAAIGIGNPRNGPFDPASSSRKFKLIVSDVGMVLFLPALTARLAASGPKLKLEAVPLDSHNFEARLATGEADIALGVYAGAPQGLRRQHLYVDDYLSVVRRGNPRRKHLGRITEFRSAQHILVTASETGHTAHRVAQETIEGAITAERDNYCWRLLRQIARGIGEDGGLAKYLVVPRREILPGLGLEANRLAVLADAGATSYGAVKRVLPKLSPGTTAVVLGVGGLGGYAVQYLHLLTDAQVIAVDVSPTKLEFAKKLGADVCLRSDDHTSATIKEITGGHGAMATLDFAGFDQTMNIAIIPWLRLELRLLVASAGVPSRTNGERLPRG